MSRLVDEQWRTASALARGAASWDRNPDTRQLPSRLPRILDGTRSTSHRASHGLFARCKAGALSRMVQLGTVLIGAHVGCAGAPPPPPTTKAVAVALPLQLAPLTAEPRGIVSLPRQSLTLELPEASLWRLDTTGSYVRGVHSETDSELWVKRWHQGERVDIDACAAQSTLWRPELNAPLQPSPARETALLAGDYHTRLTVHQWDDRGWTAAQLTAVGASIRDCLVYVYRTRAPRSPLARPVLDQRLDAMHKALLQTKYTPLDYAPER